MADSPTLSDAVDALILEVRALRQESGLRGDTLARLADEVAALHEAVRGLPCRNDGLGCIPRKRLTRA